MTAKDLEQHGWTLKHVHNDNPHAPCTAMLVRDPRPGDHPSVARSGIDKVAICRSDKSFGAAEQELFHYVTSKTCIYAPQGY